MTRVWNGGVSAPLFFAVCVLVLGVAGCGGSSSDRLSATAYKAELAKISKQADAAHGAVDAGAPKAKTVGQVETLLRQYGSAEARIGDEVSKLKAPKNAETANAELARGEHDDAAEIRALLPKLAKFKTVQQAFAYLQKLGHTKGGQEQEEAISTLKKLGYTTGS